MKIKNCVGLFKKELQIHCLSNFASLASRWHWYDEKINQNKKHFGILIIFFAGYVINI